MSTGKSTKRSDGKKCETHREQSKKKRKIEKTIANIQRDEKKNKQTKRKQQPY